MEEKRKPAKFEPVQPPALAEEVAPPALLATSAIEVTRYLDFLTNTNQTLDEVLQQFANTLREAKGKVETTSEIPAPLKEQFPRMTQVVRYTFAPDSGLFACACVLAHGKVEADLLLGQTKTWGEKLHLEKHPFLHELLQKGLTTLEHPDQSTCFALRQLLLMLLTNHPKVLESVVSKEIAPFLVEDFLADLSKPRESFDINALFVLLSAFGLKCPIYAVEEGELTAFYPSESAHLQEVEGIVIWKDDAGYSVVK